MLRSLQQTNVLRQVAGTMSIAIFTTIMTNRQIFHVRNIADGIPSDSYLATQALSQISSALAQMGTDAATATGGASAVLVGIIQKEALNSAIADTFLISAIPLFVCIPCVFLFIKRKTAKTKQKMVPAKEAAL